MRRQTVKSNSDIILKGITFELTVEDKVVKEIILTDENGNILIINGKDNYQKGINLFIKEKPEMVKKVVLEGELFGKEFKETFIDKYSADIRQNEIESAIRDGSKISLNISEQEIESDEVPF